MDVSLDGTQFRERQTKVSRWEENRLGRIRKLGKESLAEDDSRLTGSSYVATLLSTTGDDVALALAWQQKPITLVRRPVRESMGSIGDVL